MGLPIDHNAEINDIIETLESSNKMINFRIETATVDSLQKVLLCKPKIVHLSCHGDYDNENKTYLAFESKKVFGMMEKLSMNRIKKLFENQKNLKSIECMIVSACHSQNIGELMVESGVPVVVAINAPFKIQDEAARAFGKVFHSAWVQGETYQNAFTNAQNFVAAHQESYKSYSWWWAHPHKSNCKWFLDAKNIGQFEAHELHMPMCKCNQSGNLHHFNSFSYWSFVNEFLEEYATWDYLKSDKNHPNFIKLCCCSPEMPHDESMKFILLWNQIDYLKNKPFEKLEEGDVNIISLPLTENITINIDNLPAVGRNIILQSIVDSLSYSGSTQTRLVHIFGTGGVGKTFVAKHAAKYLFERRNFDHGWIYIELKNKYSVGENLSSLIWNAMGIPSTDKSTLWKFITKSKILIILDKSNRISSLDQNMLNKTLEYFIDETEIPKFIVVTNLKTDIKIQNKLQFEIDDLRPRDAARLLLLCASQFIDDCDKNLEILSNHEIFKLISRNPSWIVRFAQMLKSWSSTLDMFIINQRSKIPQIDSGLPLCEINCEEDHKSWVVKQSYERLLASYSNQVEILHILCQFPNGVIESDLKDIFSNSFPKYNDFINIMMKYKEKEEESEDKNSNNDGSFWLLSAKFVEEIGQKHYVVYPIVYSYLNQYAISNEERQLIWMNCVIYLSKLSRKLTRSMKKTEIRMLQFTKFTAAINVGMWSDDNNFENSEIYIKNSDVIIKNAKQIFMHHEANFQFYLESDLLSEFWK